MHTYVNCNHICSSERVVECLNRDAFDEAIEIAREVHTLPPSSQTLRDARTIWETIRFYLLERLASQMLYIPNADPSAGGAWRKHSLTVTPRAVTVDYLCELVRLSWGVISTEDLLSVCTNIASADGFRSAVSFELDLLSSRIHEKRTQVDEKQRTIQAAEDQLSGFSRHTRKAIRRQLAQPPRFRLAELTRDDWLRYCGFRAVETDGFAHVEKDIESIEHVLK